MPARSVRTLLRSMLLALLALLAHLAPHADAETPRLVIEADTSHLHFHFAQAVPPPPNAQIRLFESPSHSGIDGTANPTSQTAREIWSGPPRETITLPRFEKERDRLFSRFHCSLPDSPPIPPQHVSQISIPTPTRPSRLLSKKGVTCGIDSPASPTANFPRINQNIDIAQLLANAHENSAYHAKADGSSIPLNENAVRGLDCTFQRAKKAGQEVTGILLACQRKSSPLPPHIVHPLAHPETIPIGPAAFDTATAKGLLNYRAVVSWLAERYGDPNAAGGSLEGLVIGNEIQSHWSWYHLGHASKHLVLNEYAIAVRTADLAMRSRVNGLHLYLSLDHHWTQPAEENPLRGFSGREAIESLNRTFSSEGNFPWHVAFHPYPENLFNPAFWNDRTATPDFETRKITFKNIEVLAAFLRQPEFLFEGKVRSIALTEQGFHCPETADGPALQAAAFALAWKKVQAIPEVISFLYHRHVDHPHENGLKCGLFAHDGSQNVAGVGTRRPIADLLQAAGTAAETKSFAPYLAILGRSDWDQLIEPIVESSEQHTATDAISLVRLIDLLPNATRENLSDVAIKKLTNAAPHLSPAIQTHPVPHAKGELTFKIAVPDAPPAVYRAAFRSAILINNRNSTGGTFSVSINGLPVITQSPPPGKTVPIEVDLSRWAGQIISLALGVHPEKDSSYDWMTWCAPSVILRPSRKHEIPVHSGLSRP